MFSQKFPHSFCIPLFQFGEKQVFFVLGLLEKFVSKGNRSALILAVGEKRNNSNSETPKSGIKYSRHLVKNYETSKKKSQNDDYSRIRSDLRICDDGKVFGLNKQNMIWAIF
jgi:hypothetical protein